MKEDELARRFANMSDDVLMRRLQSGDMTELAQSVARAEARERGLDLPAKDGRDQHDESPPPDYVQLTRGLQPMQAYALQDSLKAEAIDACLTGIKLIEENPQWFHAVGGVRVYVAGEQREQAESILAVQQADAFGLKDDAPDELEEMPEDDGEPADLHAGRRILGWVVLVCPAFILGVFFIITIWMSPCSPGSACATSTGAAIGRVLMKLLGSIACLLPALYAITFIDKHFRAPVRKS